MDFMPCFMLCFTLCFTLCFLLQMFVELDELRLGDNQEWAWQEKARWIKFEEEIEEGALRWGKPHVSSLSFHSLLELRRCLEQGLSVLHT